MENKDTCNVCGLPFMQDKYGDWVNHGHELPE